MVVESVEIKVRFVLVWWWICE